jgi:hypothetical protein
VAVAEHDRESVICRGLIGPLEELLADRLPGLSARN